MVDLLGVNALVTFCNSLPLLSDVSCHVTGLKTVKAKLGSHVASSFYYKELYLRQNILDGKPKVSQCIHLHHQQPGIVWMR